MRPCPLYNGGVPVATSDRTSDRARTGRLLRDVSQNLSTKLIVSLDMFLVEFPGHELAPCRINTTVPLQGLFCPQLFNIDREVIREPSGGHNTMAYAFDGQVIQEFEKFLRTTEEFDDPRSFMPYLRDLNLSAKSPYSASNNPSTHFWLHSIGVLTAVSRSVNAKSFGTTQFRELLNQAISIAYFLRLSGIHSIGYSRTPEGPAKRATELETPYQTAG